MAAGLEICEAPARKPREVHKPLRRGIRVIPIKAHVESACSELPRANLARWAAVFFSASVLTFVVSLTASQAFLATSAACYAAHVLREQPKISFPPIKLPLALFSAGTVLSVLWAADPAPGWFAVRKLALFVTLLLASNLIASRKHLEFLLKGLCATSTVAALVGIVQFIRLYRVARVLYPERIYATMTSDRITGFMGHWMNFSGQQMLTIVILFAFLLLGRVTRDPGVGARGSSPPPWGSTAIWWLAFATILVSVVLSFTRAVWLGCAAAAVYLVARWRPRLLAALPFLAVAGYLLSPSMVRHRIEVLARPRSDPALSIRFEMWSVAWEMMKEHPWLGVGPNNIERQYVLFLPPGKSPEVGYHGHVHSNFFQFGAERGLPVLAAWSWLMGALAWGIWRQRKQLVRYRWVADASLAAWFAFVAEGCFESNFGTSPVLLLFLSVMAIPFAAQRIEQSEGTAPSARG